MEKRQKTIFPDDVLLDNRVDELSQEYEAGNTDLKNSERLDEVHFQISCLLGKKNCYLLREYTDRLLAHASIDQGWFYRKGLEDARRGIH